MRARFDFCRFVHEGDCTIEIGPNPENSVEPCDTENFCAICSDFAEDQTTTNFGQLSVKFQQEILCVTRKESNGLKVEDDLSALTRIDNGDGYLDRICIE